MPDSPAPFPPHDLPEPTWFTFFGVWGVVLFIVQVICAVHVLRSGRPYWWLFVILSFPGVGTLAYFLLEVRPSWRRMNWAAIAWRLKTSTQRIHIREEILDQSPTLANRFALADELIAAAEFDRAGETLEAGVNGPFAQDAELLLRLIDCLLETGRAEDAAKAFASMEQVRERGLVLRRQTAEARIAAALGKNDEADARFRELCRQDHTEAPHFYFARYLISVGRTDEGRMMLNDLLVRYRRGTPVRRGQERVWYQAARKLLAAAR